MSYIANQDIPVGSALNRLGSLLDVNINNPANGDAVTTATLTTVHIYYVKYTVPS